MKILNIGLVLAGVLLLAAKAFTPEYIDAQGFLHEAFFLLPLGFGCLFLGILVFVCRMVVSLIRRKRA